MSSKRKFQRRRSSVLTDAQQDTLEWKLNQRRGSLDALEKRGLAIAGTGGMSHRLQSAAKSLERSMISDNLNQALYDRQAPETIHENVMRGAKVAPRIRKASVMLEHRMKSDTIGHLLEQRSEPEDLEARGLLRDLNVAPGLQGTQRALERNLAKSNLYHALQRRPSVVELIEAGYYQEADDSGSDYNYDDASEDDASEDYEDAAVGEEEYDEQDEYDDEGYDNEEEARRQALEDVFQSLPFQCTRVLLKTVAQMARQGEISQGQKGTLKDMVVDQDPEILQVAQVFLETQNVNGLKEDLLSLAYSVHGEESTSE